MAYSAINDTEIEPGKPITTSLMTRMRDNPLSILSGLGWAPTAKRTISTEFTPTVSSLVTFNHLLTVSNPFEIDYSVYLICKTAEHNYSVGDIIAINPAGDENDLNSSFSATLTTSQILLRLGGVALVIRNKTTGTLATITVANWRLVIKARA